MSGDTSFVPLSDRADPARSADYSALVEGVPPWLGPSLRVWIARAISDGTYNESDVFELISAAQRVLRLPINTSTNPRGLAELQDLCASDETVCLKVVDFFLHLEFGDREGLEGYLSQAGSVWMVAASSAAGRYRLERRVRKETTALVEHAASLSERVGTHLREAWQSIYGRNPDASKGYREAVRAVEAAATGVVLPADTSATLGKIIPALRDGAGNFRSVLAPTSGDPIATTVAMLELLWKSQLDRHGTPDPKAPLYVSLPEAEAALHLAATLVQWFGSAAITRR